MRIGFEKQTFLSMQHTVTTIPRYHVNNFHAMGRFVQSRSSCYQEKDFKSFRISKFHFSSYCNINPPCTQQGNLIIITKTLLTIIEGMGNHMTLILIKYGFINHKSSLSFLHYGLALCIPLFLYFTTFPSNIYNHNNNKSLVKYTIKRGKYRWISQ